jgi:hypothetical protein
MNKEIPSLDIEVKELTFSSKIIKVELTRRKVFFKGFFGKARCLYYWADYCIEKKFVGLDEWLDQTIAYSIEPDLKLYSHDFNNEIKMALEKYLIDDAPQPSK